MAGLVPAIHVFACGAKDVDARHKAGHDGEYRFSVIGKRSSAVRPVRRASSLQIARYPPSAMTIVPVT